MMLCIVEPVLHKYEVAEPDVNVTLPPWQNVVLPPGVIDGIAGFEFTVIVVGAEEAEHPPELVMVTE